MNQRIMACVIIFSFVFMLSFSSAFFQETKMIPQNDTNIDHKTIETYIVHVSLPAGLNSSNLVDLDGWYYSFFPINPMTGLNDVSRVIHSYHKVISGFAARLTAEEVKEMAKKDGFLSAKPQKILALQTTHSPDFLGLHKNVGVWPKSNYGKGVIIGVIDTGITPLHPSFNDKDMPSPPAKWKGGCQFRSSLCNKKLIGMRDFVDKSGIPFDKDGHGTHTASIAAGNFVPNANVFENANGTAVGMAPLAHLAIYRACTRGNCHEADVLAAMDAAMEDGVDVLSISLAGDPTPFFADNIAIGAFIAIQNGVFVSCSAGNYGPFSQTLLNGAPWILTVGASTVDRVIRATAKLGNDQEFDGQFLCNPKDFTAELLPLVYPSFIDGQSLALCDKESLDKIDVKEKIVLCHDGLDDKGKAVKDAGGAAMILINELVYGYTTVAKVHVLPTIQVNFADGEAIKAYINSTSNPTATISFKGTILGIKEAPAVAGFSSRGPNYASPGILKPDVLGPGVDILAAWNDSVENKISSNSNFNMIAGTSMSCPHLSGIVALLKNAHPEWSPAAIKSAIMTTANIVNVNGDPIIDERRIPADIFAIGAGHVNASRAIDPGLLYDLEPDDYIPYLCGLGYSDKNVRTIVRKKDVKCSNVSSIPEAQLNYPSFSIQLLDNTTQTYSRIVKNVGIAVSSYHVEIEKIPGIEISVQPSVLSFTELYQQRSYQISFRRTTSSNNSTFVQGSITWISEHKVRSPIAIQLVKEIIQKL